jgi:isopentenyl-diphosphate delta-isomerase
LEEQVILVNETDHPVGTMGKAEAHQAPILHRAFSIFIFNSEGEMLLQKRAPNKYHSAGLWTNTCCSHPRPEEDTVAAAARRLKEEMGFCTSLEKVFDFIYKASFDNGLHEYEFDHVFTGIYDDSVSPNPDEVSEYRFMSMESIQSSLDLNPENFTAWFNIVFPKITTWKYETIKKAI